MASPYSSHLSDGEWKQLQSLLVKARNAGQLGEVCIQARVEGEEIVRQQQAWRANNTAAMEAYSQLLAAAEAKRSGPMTSGSMAAGSQAASSSGSEGPSQGLSGGISNRGLSQAAINQIVGVATTPEDKVLMSVLAGNASEDGTVGLKVVGPNTNSAKKQRPEPPLLPQEQPPCPSIAVFAMGEVEHGAMTDAAKRRFDPGSEIGVDDEFEVVQAGNYFDPNDLQIDLASVIAEAPVTSPAPATSGRVLGYQEGVGIISEAERGWYPPIATQVVDMAVPLPPGIESHEAWGKTKIVMPKYAASNYCYEQAFRMSMGADFEMAKYLGWIVRKYGPIYMRLGSRSQASDLAGYLLRAKYRVGTPPTMPTQAPGFKREF